MKKIGMLMLVLSFAFAIAISAQQKENSKAPANVVGAFQTAHPKAQDVTWDKEGINYEANYKENGNDFSVVINNAGKILETESEIKISELPSGVIKYLNDNYKDYTVSDASKIVDDKGNIKYEAELKFGKMSRDVMFTEEGKPLPSNNEEQDEKEDND